MAPPNRRPGYSRRAQYSTFFAYLAGAAGALIGAVLLLISLANPTAFSWLRGWGSDAVAPVGRAASTARTSSLGFFETVGGYFAAARQNARLRREIEAAKVRLVEAQAQTEENRRLKMLLGLNDSEARPVTYARLISSTSSSTRRFGTLSAGARDGITVGMPVRSPLGLVGRVLEVGNATSRVLLVTDPESVVPVRRASDGIPAFAQGRSDGTLQIRLISLGINPLKPGDTFVTSGAGGLFRPGTAIAVVGSLTRDGALGRLLSDPSASEYVAVEPVWAPEALPARPGATSTPAGQP